MFATETGPPTLAEVRDLRVTFAPRSAEPVEAVKGVSFAVQAGETVAVIGESGSGKSVSALALGGLLPRMPTCRIEGEITVAGTSISAKNEAAVRRLRGRELAYIFQEPGASMNPMLRVGAQLEEAFRLHRPDLKDRRRAATDALDAVGIHDAAARLRAFPEALSGGMLQRVMIAMALAGQPRLLVADEPTTALDATVQKQVIDLLAHLRQATGMAILFISHNLALVKGFADRVLVMWRGEVVETGPVDQVLSAPEHPYTQALLACLPQAGNRGQRLPVLADFGL